MSNKQKLKRAYINVGYAQHTDILSLTRRFGIQGKCASYDLILAMSAASNGVIDEDAFLYICELNQVADPAGHLKYCLDKGIFLATPDGITNVFVAKDQESYAKKLEDDRERKPKKTGIRPENDRNLDIDIDNESINKKEIDLPPGKKLYGSFIWLSDFDREDLLQKYSAQNVTAKDIPYAINLLDTHILKNPTDQNLKLGRDHAAQVLKTWPLERTVEYVTKQNRLKQSSQTRVPDKPPPNRVPQNGFVGNLIKQTTQKLEGVG